MIKGIAKCPEKGGGVHKVDKGMKGILNSGKGESDEKQN
jgi:hypothetical protein